MGSTGKVALSVIMGIGAVTGILCYYAFSLVAPEPGAAAPVGTLEPAASSANGSGESEGNEAPTTSTTSADSSGNATISNATDTSTNASTLVTGPSVTAGTPASLTIPQGASVQGSTYYEPDPLTIKVGDTISVDNQDAAPHTVTNGRDATDPDMGKLFDTSIINAGESGEIVSTALEPGEYPYFCTLHPYMVGTLTVQ